jgi:A/G-specific adenine glycosylase
MLEKNFFVNWYKNHGRDFPWRRAGTTPFAFLVTEMLLRQTRAAGVAKLWNEFVKKYPDAEAMARANTWDLVDQLEILGFGNQKAGALVSAAKWLVEHHGGCVPSILDELLNIPHIGLYSARAILCFAFGHRIEIVDTNIQRFFARYYGIDVKPDIRRNPFIWEIAKQALPKGRKKAIQHN